MSCSHTTFPHSLFYCIFRSLKKKISSDSSLTTGRGIHSRFALIMFPSNIIFSLLEYGDRGIQWKVVPLTYQMLTFFAKHTVNKWFSFFFLILSYSRCWAYRSKWKHSLSIQSHHLGEEYVGNKSQPVCCGSWWKSIKGTAESLNRRRATEGNLWREWEEESEG